MPYETFFTLVQCSPEYHCFDFLLLPTPPPTHTTPTPINKQNLHISIDFYLLPFCCQEIAYKVIKMIWYFGFGFASLRKRLFISNLRVGVKKTNILRSGFLWIFFGALLTLYYDYMCSETDFTPEKVDFHANTGIPNSSSYCCCPPDDHLQEAGPTGW